MNATRTTSATTLTPASPYLDELRETAWHLGTSRNASVNANGQIEEIASQVVGYYGADDIDGTPIIGADLSNAQVVILAQTYFDGLAVYYGLEPGEVIVHAGPRPWASS